METVQIIERAGEIEIPGVSDFVPELIFECGQCFRWEARPDAYVGVAHGRAARVRVAGESIFISGGIREFEKVWRGYFDLDRDYAAIRKAVSIDGYMASAVSYGAGIRILRQDKWEALCSFIISQCNNIGRIKGIISKLCRLFGDEIEFEGEAMYTFPTADRIAGLNAEKLAPLRCGYRDEYILSAARRVASGISDLDEIAALPQDEMRKALQQFPGVGPKVANCVMLFGMGCLDAFPVDVWIKRTLKEHYSAGFDPSSFGGYAGIAQQYIFHYSRTGGDLAG